MLFNAYDLSQMLTRFTLLLIPFISFAEDKDLKATLTMTIAENNLPPLYDTTTAIVKEAYQKIGFEIIIKKFPIKRALLLANTGKYSGDICRVKNLQKSYKNLIMVPVPIFSVSIYVLSKKKLDVSKGITPHKDKTYCSIHGIEAFSIAKIKLREGAKMKSFKETLSGVVFGRCDIAFSTDYLFKLAQKKKPILKRILVQNKPAIKTWNLYHYIHKKHIKLLPKITKVLEDMKKTGRIDEITASFNKL